KMWVGSCCLKAVVLRKRHAPNLMSWLGGIFGVGVQVPAVSVALTVLKATRPRATPSSTAIVCGMVREGFIGLGVLCGRAYNTCNYACSAGPLWGTRHLLPCAWSMQWSVYTGSLTYVTYTPLPPSSLYATSQIVCNRRHVQCEGTRELAVRHNPELSRTCRH